jgi:hypothetical protein
MPEAGGANIEIAQHLNEPEKRSKVKTPRRTEILEIFEAVVLALVAVSTAWSGYQAARWDGQQSLLYGRSSKLRIEVQGMELRGNQIAPAGPMAMPDSCGQKTRPSRCLEIIAQRTLMKSGPRGLLPVEIPSILNICCEPIARCPVDFYAASLS